MTLPPHSFTVYLCVPIKGAACREQWRGTPQPTSRKQRSGLDSLLEVCIFLTNGGGAEVMGIPILLQEWSD